VILPRELKIKEKRFNVSCLKFGTLSTDYTQDNIF